MAKHGIEGITGWMRHPQEIRHRRQLRTIGSPMLPSDSSGRGTQIEDRGQPSGEANEHSSKPNTWRPICTVGANLADPGPPK